MTDAWSITDGYWDTDGRWHATSEETRRAVRAAMGGDETGSPPPGPPMWFLEAGSAASLADRCALVLEDGTTRPELAELPPDLPIGYHDLHPIAGGPAIRLVVTPRRAPLPERAWGWAVQLYALRSASSWGMGDLGDLRRLAEWSAGLGAGVLMVNPLHAAAPTHPQQPSPYSPTSRLWRNVAYLRVPELAGADALGADLESLEATGRRLNALDRIDRDAVVALKLKAAAGVHAAFERGEVGGPGDRAAFETWVAANGEPLESFAVWSALAEEYGADWTTWPADYRHPASAAVRAFAGAHTGRVRLHQWCQWQLDQQLARAGEAGTKLVADLAVGFDPSGADAWAYQDLLGDGCRVGAPPDTFNPLGQDWALPPFVPWKLRNACYQPFIDTLRASFAHGGGIRIDHVMGLFRLYWIPPGRGPRDGVYVRYPASELLDLVAVEAHRAGAFVVGEDLGTVEDEVRAELTARNVLSYRLVWFEEGPPSTFPRQALAGITTHDLPTIAGVWSGADLAERRRLGRPDDGSDTWYRSRIRLATGLDDDAPTEDVIIATHEALAGAPSLIVVATIDDAIGMVERPNLPGTVDEWPNWRIPLHRPLEQIESDPVVNAIARTLDAGVHGRAGADLPSSP